MNKYDVLTQGGPLDGEIREMPDSAYKWPPPVNLPGIFHGGVYIREQFVSYPRRLATYKWEDRRGEDVFAT